MKALSTRTAIIIDDVLTTDVTVSEMAKTRRQADAKRVIVWVVAATT